MPKCSKNSIYKYYSKEMVIKRVKLIEDSKSRHSIHELSLIFKIQFLPWILLYGVIEYLIK